MTSEQSLSAEAIERRRNEALGEIARIKDYDTPTTRHMNQALRAKEDLALCDMALAALTRPALSEERIREIAISAACEIGAKGFSDTGNGRRRADVIDRAIRQALREQSQQESRHD